jgi:hypothetical protein
MYGAIRKIDSVDGLLYWDGTSLFDANKDLKCDHWRSRNCWVDMMMRLYGK